MPAAAPAQDVSRTDPEIGSPAEEVYGIPFEEARRDAAPGFLPGPTLRTENSVGSSARVPGRRGEGRDRSGREGPERVQRRRRARRRDAAEAATQISGDPSPVATTALLLLVVGVAAAGGVGAGRLARGRPLP